MTEETEPMELEDGVLDAIEIGDNDLECVSGGMRIITADPKILKKIEEMKRDLQSARKKVQE